MSGAKIIEGLKDAVAGNFSSVTIEGQTWAPDRGWQPISTAPKDGTIVLLYERAELEVYAGYCFDRIWRPLASNWETIPTHWRPLPAPPTSEPLP